MRSLFIIIVIGALGYLGWVYREELTAKVQEVTQSAKATAAATPSVGPTPEPAATPAPTATNQIAPPADHIAPPGTFFVLKRVSVEVPNGIKALNPGETVKLMYRNKDGTVRVTTGKDEFLIKEDLLTNDFDKVEHTAPRR